jgi:hypothetical protein
LCVCAGVWCRVGMRKCFKKINLNNVGILLINFEPGRALISS